MPDPRPELVEAAARVLRNLVEYGFEPLSMQRARAVLAAVLPLLTPADVPHLFAGNDDAEWEMDARLRDWLHETPMSRCSASSDTCDTWSLAHELGRIARGRERAR